MKRELLETLYHSSVELCVQDGPNADGTNKAWNWENHFADLIIKECIRLQYQNVIVGGPSEYNRGRRELAEDIMKHFGVADE